MKIAKCENPKVEIFRKRMGTGRYELETRMSLALDLSIGSGYVRGHFRTVSATATL